MPVKDSAVEKAKGIKDATVETIEHATNVAKEKAVEIVHRAEEAVEGNSCLPVVSTIRLKKYWKA
jgi:hypothetical protein